MQHGLRYSDYFDRRLLHFCDWCYKTPVTVLSFSWQHSTDSLIGLGQTSLLANAANWSAVGCCSNFLFLFLLGITVCQLSLLDLVPPDFFLSLNFLLICLDAVMCEQPSSLAMTVYGLSSSLTFSLTIVNSAVLPVSVYATILKIYIYIYGLV